MGGMASGIDTDGIIKKLMDVEARPIVQLEKGKKRNRARKGALQKLEGKLKTLNSAAQNLYGHRAAYDNKSAVSSNPLIVSAVANKRADVGIRSVEIINMASTHKMTTDSFPKKKKLPAGKFTIEVKGEKRTIRFRGGQLSSLRDRIHEESNDVVGVSLIKTYGDNYLMTIQSKTPGKKGEIKLKGDLSFLKKIGLVKGYKDGTKKEVKLVFDRKFFSKYKGDEKIKYNDGKLNISKDGSSVSLSGQLWQEYKLPVETEIKDDTVLSIHFVHKKDALEEDKLPSKIETGPKNTVNIKGIILDGYNISRLRPLDKKKKRIFTSVIGVGVVTTEKGKRVEKIYSFDKDGSKKQDIPLGKDFKGKKIEKVILYCNDGKGTFSNAMLLTPEKDKGLLDPKNEISKALNANLKIDGIKIERDTNNDLKDVIKGVTLNIRGTTKVPVEIKINPDSKVAVERIKKFVEAYNDYIAYHNKMIKTEKQSRPGNYKKKNRIKGLFVGDMTIIRLENMIKRTVTNAYSSRADKPIKMFYQIGVSTGAIGAKWKTIQQGKLILDEDKLTQAIVENPEGVKMFFSSDTDGDNLPDNGMAFNLVRILKPYVWSNNIIKTKMKMEDESIKMANDRIAKKEQHLKVYQQKLRTKFGNMEKIISSSNAQKNWLNQQMGGKK